MHRMTEEKVCFTRLNSKNYDALKFKMEIYLTDKELCHVISTDNNAGQKKKKKHGLKVINMP